MSSKLHGLVWEACAFKGLIISEIAVMARLADFSNDEGISWPAVTTIQRQIGAKSENTVRSAIKKLQAKGWLKKQERRIGGKNNSNVYKLNVDMLERAAAEAKLFYATSREQSKFDASEIEGSKFEGSNSDASNNGSASPQILRGDPSMVEGDPSLDPSLDPSSKKPSCRAPAEPDDKPDPEVVITDHAIEVLTHLNQVSGSRFQKSKTSLENIRARLREGHYRAQGFPDWYIIDRDYRGVKYSKEKQVARCGNAVPPPFAEALVRANLPEMCINKQERAA